MSILNRQVNSFSNFVSFFIVITHNTLVNFKLMHFLLLIKGLNKSPNFETFVCCGENLPNSSCHFPNHESLFLQILYHSLASWNTTPLVDSLVTDVQIRKKYITLKHLISFLMHDIMRKLTISRAKGYVEVVKLAFFMILHVSYV